MIFGQKEPQKHHRSHASFQSILSNIAMLWDNRSVCSDMFYFHWLIKIPLWPVSGQNNARRERHTENQRDVIKQQEQQDVLDHK